MIRPLSFVLSAFPALAFQSTTGDTNERRAGRIPISTAHTCASHADLKLQSIHLPSVRRLS